jgi:hypothetical protein
MKSFATYIKRKDGPYRTLLHPFPTDDTQEIERKKKRLAELANQYPAMLVIEGDRYKKKNLTYTQQRGKRPVPFFEVEERIMANVPLRDIRQILVPQSKVNEVEEWLDEKKAKIKKHPRVVAFEYFEIKRLLVHQKNAMLETRK